MGRELEQHFPKDYTEMANEHNEKMVNIISHLKSVNKNHNEV